jgi:hypothetical protein
MSGNHRGSLVRQRAIAAAAGVKNAHNIGGISPGVQKKISKVFNSNKAKKIYNDLSKKQPIQGGNKMNNAALKNAAARLAHLLNNKVNTLKNKANKAAKNVNNLKMGGRRRRKTRKRRRRRTRKGGKCGCKNSHPKKGQASLTRIGNQDFTTKRGNQNFHQNNHNVKKNRKPYTN